QRRQRRQHPARSGSTVASAACDARPSGAVATMALILEARPLTPITKLFKLDAPLIAASAEPGQFVMLRVREGGERIPITIADYDRKAGTITIVVQEAGATTARVC